MREFWYQFWIATKNYKKKFAFSLISAAFFFTLFVKQESSVAKAFLFIMTFVYPFIVLSYALIDTLRRDKRHDS